MQVGLATLRLGIRGYRRFLSGRGPLRAVGCSFVHCESCSAYGLRMAQSAPSLVVALSRIRARLRRCRSLSVYRLHTQGHEVLAWGLDYEQPSTLAETLRATDERPETQWAVLDAARQIAAYRGQWRLVAQHLAERDASRSSAPPRSCRLLLRRGERVLESLLRRAQLEVLTLCLLSAIILAFTPLALALALSSLLGLAALHTTTHMLRRRRRFARLIAAAQFSTGARAELRAPDPMRV